MCAFLVQMVCVGMVGMILCPVGRNQRTDRYHAACTIVMLFDHHLWFGFLGTAPFWRGGFYMCALLFAMAGWLSNQLIDRSFRAHEGKGVVSDPSGSSASVVSTWLR